MAKSNKELRAIAVAILDAIWNINVVDKQIEAIIALLEDEFDQDENGYHYYEGEARFQHGGTCKACGYDFLP